MILMGELFVIHAAHTEYGSHPEWNACAPPPPDARPLPALISFWQAEHFFPDRRHAFPGPSRISLTVLIEIEHPAVDSEQFDRHVKALGKSRGIQDAALRNDSFH